MTKVNLLQERIKINDNLYIPALLFGTYKIDEKTLQLALENGFTSFDMAAVYNTGNLVFSAISKYIAAHNMIDCRDQFHFCYKLDATKLSAEQVVEQVDSLLDKITAVFPERPPYIDMLAIHSPNHNIPIEATWACMQSFVRSGKVVAVGVSNFNLYHLKCMAAMQLEAPAINQVEINPFFSQPELAEYCQANHIKISSYRSSRNKAASEDLVLLAKIAAELNISQIQVINSWKFSKGYQILAVSSKPEHIEELKSVTRLDPFYIQQLDCLDKGDIGRTCSGSWSRFDFCDSKWNESVDDELVPAKHKLEPSMQA